MSTWMRDFDKLEVSRTQEDPDYQCFDRARLISELNACVNKALDAGVTMEQIEGIATNVFKCLKN